MNFVKTYPQSFPSTSRRPQFEKIVIKILATEDDFLIFDQFLKITTKTLPNQQIFLFIFF